MVYQLQGTSLRCLVGDSIPSLVNQGFEIRDSKGTGSVYTLYLYLHGYFLLCPNSK